MLSIGHRRTPTSGTSQKKSFTRSTERLCTHARALKWSGNAFAPFTIERKKREFSDHDDAAQNVVDSLLGATASVYCMNRDKYASALGHGHSTVRFDDICTFFLLILKLVCACVPVLAFELLFPKLFRGSHGQRNRRRRQTCNHGGAAPLVHLIGYSCLGFKS